MKNWFCELLGHEYIEIGYHERVCFKCNKVETDIDLTGLPVKAVRKYINEIINCYYGILFDWFLNERK